MRSCTDSPGAPLSTAPRGTMRQPQHDAETQRTGLQTSKRTSNRSGPAEVRRGCALTSAKTQHSRSASANGIEACNPLDPPPSDPWEYDFNHHIMKSAIDEVRRSPVQLRPMRNGLSCKTDAILTMTITIAIAGMAEACNLRRKSPPTAAPNTFGRAPSLASTPPHRHAQIPSATKSLANANSPYRDGSPSLSANSMSSAICHSSGSARRQAA